MTVEVEKLQDNNYNSIRILTIDGSDVYRAMHRVDGTRGLTVKDKNGRLNTSRFRGFLDSSLDTDRMKKVYASHKELPGSFRVCKEYTTAVVNVSFDYTVKDFFNKGKRFFVRDGYDARYGMLRDHAYTVEEDGKRRLIAIEVADGLKLTDERYAPVEEPLDEETLGGYFRYDEDSRAYYLCSPFTDESGFKTLKTKKEVRSWLYENGFDIDGIHYVRYKRSAGSSREGHCLFIAEPLYEDMMEWSRCGLDTDNVTDQASWQAYISLTLSSIEKKIHIPRQSIMIINDQVSRFRDTVIRVSEKNGGLTATKEEVDIENVIWDGEALLDRSVFEENGYSDKGMMLLRNRFFKTCAFNTNLQQWFADHGITRLSQLSGYCSARARSIKDIKLVITASSLKYLKFRSCGLTLGDCFEKWLDNIYTDKESALFGVVKTDKVTGKMNGRMVSTNYQLLNTLELSREGIDDILEDSLELLHSIQTDPMYLRYYMDLFVTDGYDEDDGSNTGNYRKRLLSDMMRRSDDFEGTVFYRAYRSELCKSFKSRLKRGRILIDGGYHTLLGNGIEFLKAVIDKDYVVSEPLALADGEIYAPDFPDGEELLCERSPHITMGNLLVARNKHSELIDRYFNFGTARSIVCVNAIKSNIQQRLNGCDYDSDSMLITSEPTLRDAAKRNYGEFCVPFCDVHAGGSVSYTTSPDDLAALDIKISENKIGEIVNLSQFLNSIYWEKRSKGEDGELEGLYSDICKLAVLSGMEIDKAKRLFKVSADAVLGELRVYKERYRAEHNGKLPEFFEYITSDDFSDKDREDERLDTSMSFLYDAIKSDKGRSPRSKTVRYTELFELHFDKADPTGAYVKRRESVLKLVQEAQERIHHLNFISKRRNRSERLLAMAEAEELFEECKERISKVADDHLYYLLLTELDRGEEENKRVSAFHALLLAAMCYAGDGYLMKRLKKPEREMLDIIPSDGSEPSEEILYIYGHPHIMGRRHK